MVARSLILNLGYCQQGYIVLTLAVDVQCAALNNRIRDFDDQSWLVGRGRRHTRNDKTAETSQRRPVPIILSVATRTYE